MNPYQRLFGAGPLGATISVALLLASMWLARYFDHLKITSNDELRGVVFGLLSLVALLIIAWSIRSLPPGKRGHQLVTAGAFAWFRHPLYGAFLSFFNFGFAFFLNNWVYIVWAIAQYPVWHLVIRSEEELMKRAFPEEYQAYAARTGRFFPRPWNR